MKIDLATTTDLFRLLSDESRVRLLALLERDELTVVELTRITGLGQSRVSTHLGKLRDAGLVVDRPQGASTFYRLNDARMPEAARRAFELLRGQLKDALLERDLAALDETLAGRNGSHRMGGSWADSVAGQMDRHYSPGRTWEATAWGTLGLARLGSVLDVASGDGVTAELLSGRSAHVTCLDRSERVATAGRRRLAHIRNVSYVRGDMHAMPFANGSFDQALVMHALTYSEAPVRVFAELGRVLRPGGMVVVATLERHAHRDVIERFDHRRLGFEPLELAELVRNAGFTVEMCRVTSRERQKPHHGVVTVYAHRNEIVKQGPASRNGRATARTAKRSVTRTNGKQA